MNINSRNHENVTENENSKENTENENSDTYKNSSIHDKDEAAVSSENIEDENNNQQERNCPKRNKKPIMRLAPYVSHMYSKEAENNESAEY